ncbi:MAG: M14 family metallopeptidase [Chloroherpetonaceae bacterium]|nr:M14 family metallopeptidase [Chloroherpetonaceae bacterium]
MTHRFFLAPLLLLFLYTPLTAQVKLDYYLPKVDYNPQVPTPEAFFGFQIGEWHLRPDQIDAYLYALAATSERVTIERIGKTYEERPLLLVIITSPENQRNLAFIKQQHKDLTNPQKSSRLSIESMPVVVWLGYSVHGDEPSGANAVPLIAYHLAAALDDEVEKWLRNTIILLDPHINPDGIARFAQWANMHKGKHVIADPEHREHNQLFPAGRFNHYWFDLNRDWLPVQLLESQARLAKFHEWMPNILTDHHEQGTNATFFFQPGVPSRNHPLLPKRTIELTEAIAQYHAKALDEIGSLYFTKENYDDFYFGKGSTYPDLQGCIGILFEQASSRGHAQESANGVLTFSFTIRNQVVTTFSTLRAAQALRKDLLSHQRDFFASALVEAEKSPVKTYIFGSPSDAAKNFHFVDFLRRHGIEVYELTKDLKAGGTEFKAGKAFAVPTNQPQYRLITAIFEKRTSFQDSLFYDISAWTMPLAFGLPFAELGSRVEGKRIDTLIFPQGKVIGSKASYAYLFDWSPYYAPRALYQLQKAGLRVKVATQPFEITTQAGMRKFDYGTVMVAVSQQRLSPDSLFALMERVARSNALEIYAVSTGLSTVGLGSSSFETVSLPRLAMLTGVSITPTDAGEIWHLLDQRFNIELSLLELSQLGRVNLSKYSAVLMPSGSYSALDSAGIANLRRYVLQGGTLVAIKGAVEWLIQRGIITEKIKKPKDDTARIRRPFEHIEEDERAQTITGAIFEATLDRSHPLCFGYESDKIALFRDHTLFLELSRNQYATPLQYTAKPLLSGYISKRNEEALRNTAAALVSRVGAGRAILFADNPNFRAFWYGTNKLFLNSLFFGAIMTRGARAETPNEDASH